MNKRATGIIGAIVCAFLFFHFKKVSYFDLFSLKTNIDVDFEDELHNGNSDHFFFCTATDERYFYHLLNLIGSIHKQHFDQLGQIAVFDLGLSAHQLKILSNIQKVHVYPLDLINPVMLTPFITDKFGKSARGWYTWKPAAIMQFMNMLPEDYSFLWIDSGTTVLKDISSLFAYIKYHGYFFHNGWNWPLKRQTTQFVIKQLHLESDDLRWLLADDVYCIEAGLMGISKTIRESIIEPVYEMAKDIRYFEDDGTTPNGFGEARHDQTLLAIKVRQNHLHVFDHFEDHKASFVLSYADINVPFHVGSLTLWTNPDTAIVCTRHDLNNLAHYLGQIRHHNYNLSYALFSWIYAKEKLKSILKIK